MKKLIAQFMKFGIVGVIAFVIDYGVMIFLTEVFGVCLLYTSKWFPRRQPNRVNGA